MKDLADLIDDLTAINANLRLEHRKWSVAAEDSLVPPFVAELRRLHNALGRLIAEADDLREMAQIKRMQDFLVDKGLFGEYSETLLR